MFPAFSALLRPLIVCPEIDKCFYGFVKMDYGIHFALQYASNVYQMTI